MHSTQVFICYSHPTVFMVVCMKVRTFCYFGAGYIRFKDGFQESFSVEDYLDLFDLAAHKIQEAISGNSSGAHRALHLITGEHM